MAVIEPTGWGGHLQRATSLEVGREILRQFAEDADLKALPTLYSQSNVLVSLATVIPFQDVARIILRQAKGYIRKVLDSDDFIISDIILEEASLYPTLVSITILYNMIETKPINKFINNRLYRFKKHA